MTALISPGGLILLGFTPRSPSSVPQLGDEVSVAATAGAVPGDSGCGDTAPSRGRGRAGGTRGHRAAREGPAGWEGQQRTQGSLREEEKGMLERRGKDVRRFGCADRQGRDI